VFAPRVDSGEKDVDRGLDDPVGVELARAGTAQHISKGTEGLVDQDEAERFHRIEMPVERGRGDPGCAGDLPEAQRAEAAVFEQGQRCGDDRAAGCLLALLAGGRIPRTRPA
jgi:hypothetical protein